MQKKYLEILQSYENEWQYILLHIYNMLKLQHDSLNVVHHQFE